MGPGKTDMTQPSPQWLWFVDDELVHKFLALDPENPAVAKRASAHPALTNAVRLKLEGAPERALEQLRPAIAAGDEDALMLAGQIRFELCRFDEAAATYGQLAEKCPGNRVASFNQGLCLARLHKWTAAVDCLQRAAVRDPERMEVWQTLGICLLNAKRMPGADACFKQALKLRPDYVPALLGRAAASQMQGDHRAALAIYERLLESQPERIELLVNALSAAAGVQDREKTAALAARLLNLRPGHPAAGVALADAALQREDFDTAIRLCSELTQTLPDSFDNWFNLGICCHRTGQFQSAVEAFDRALEITAGDPDALEAKARAWSASDRTVEALEAWDAVVRAAPERGEAWFQKGRLHYESGQWKDAADAFEHCRERSTEHPVQVVLNLGLSRWKAGQLAAARDALELTLVQDPENTAARTALVAIEIDSGDPSTALQRYRELGIGTPEITYNLALLCHEHGQLKEAAQFYREAVELNPGSGEARLNLGNVLFAMGDRAAAGRLWKGAIDANPGLAARFMAVWD